MLETDGATTRLTVADDGPGIPAPLRKRAKARFVRLQGEQGPSGSGLGLAIVQATVERLGARLEMREGNPGLHVSVLFTPGTGGNQGAA